MLERVNAFISNKTETCSEGRILNLKPYFALFKAYVQLTRPSGVMLIGFATIIGQIVALKRLPEPSVFVFPLIASTLATASSFVINDCLDVDSDSINKPKRPLPSGAISRKSAFRFGIALFFSFFMVSLATNFIALCVLMFTYWLSIFYSVFAKRTGLFGNIIVAFCVSIAFLYGSISVTDSINFIGFSLLFLSFFANLGREITQSIQDMDGDKLKGIRSVALVNGPRFAAILGSLCCGITIFLGPMIFFYLSKNPSFHYLIVLFPEVGFLFSIFYLLKEPTKNGAAKFIKQVNFWTAMILVAIILTISF
uniref:Digeranylgeranylglyceryl phosphate synthase n=1 Tax=Candidatus Methanomethylicus mesodigestus TaxID=1867258 RepID=A0A7C3FBY1_9CREN